MRRSDVMYVAIGLAGAVVGGCGSATSIGLQVQHELHRVRQKTLRRGTEVPGGYRDTLCAIAMAQAYAGAPDGALETLAQCPEPTCGPRLFQALLESRHLEAAERLLADAGTGEGPADLAARWADLAVAYATRGRPTDVGRAARRAEAILCRLPAIESVRVLSRLAFAHRIHDVGASASALQRAQALVEAMPPERIAGRAVAWCSLAEAMPPSTGRKTPDVRWPKPRP